MAFKAWHLPVRLATGAYILNSGLSKRGTPPEAAAEIHGRAVSGNPEFQDMEAEQFVSLLSNGEIALGAALLVPFVPSWLAGLGLTAFSAGLVRQYLNLPGMRQEGSVAPTEQGIALAKDVWMLSIGLALVLDRATQRQNVSVIEVDSD